MLNKDQEKREEIMEKRVVCNDIKCKYEWFVELEEWQVEGNRIVCGPSIVCPKCGRIDRPYILEQK